jgi:hypothetical protein
MRDRADFFNRILACLQSQVQLIAEAGVESQVSKWGRGVESGCSTAGNGWTEEAALDTLI